MNFEARAQVSAIIPAMKMSASRDPVSNGSVSSVVAHADSRAHAAAGDASERNRSATSDRVHASAEPVDVGEELEEELEWEDWNGRGSFGHHMIAGSAAGVVEHLAMFPVDTYKVRAVQYTAMGHPGPQGGMDRAKRGNKCIWPKEGMCRV